MLGEGAGGWEFAHPGETLLPQSSWTLGQGARSPAFRGRAQTQRSPGRRGRSREPRAQRWWGQLR